MGTIPNPYEQMSERQRGLIEYLARQTGLSGGHEAWTKWGWNDGKSKWPRTVSVREASGIITLLKMHQTVRQRVGPVPSIKQGNQK